MRRKLITLVAVIAAVGALTTGAIAQQEPDSDQAAGRLWAFGSGTATLDVEQGVVRVNAVGDITITGPAGLDVVVNSWLDGAQAVPESTTIELTGFAGTVTVRGSDYQIVVDGVTALKGAGSGQATFDGEGLWKTRHNQGVWPDVIGLTDGGSA